MLLTIVMIAAFVLTFLEREHCGDLVAVISKRPSKSHLTASATIWRTVAILLSYVALV